MWHWQSGTQLYVALCPETGHCTPMYVTGGNKIKQLLYAVIPSLYAALYTETSHLTMYEVLPIDERPVARQRSLQVALAGWKVGRLEGRQIGRLAGWQRTSEVVHSTYQTDRPSVATSPAPGRAGDRTKI